MSRLAGALLLLAAGLEALPALAVRPTLHRYGTEDGLPQSQVTAIAQDARGVLWVGTLAGGVGRFDGQQFSVHDVSSGLPANAVYALVADPSGGVLAATAGGLAREVDERFQPVPLPLDSATAAVYDILLERGGRLWLATRGGLLVRQPAAGAFTRVAGEPALAGKTVRSLAADGHGGVWVGCDAGLAHVSDPRSPRLESVPGLPSGFIPFLLARPSRPLLVAVRDAGLYQGESGRFSRVGDDEIPGRDVLHLLPEADDLDAVWIGTRDKGAFRMRDGRPGRSVRFEALGTAEGLPAADVHVQLEDREGVLWLGTGAGLVKKGPAAFATLGTEEGFPSPTAPVFGMAETRDGNLWFGLGPGGLFRSGPSGSRLFGARDGLGPGEVSSLSASRADASLWVAASGGLLRVQGDEVRSVGLPGLPSRIDLVLAMPDGSVVVSAGAQGTFRVRAGAVEPLGEKVPGRVYSMTVDAGGTLWLGGDGWGVVGVPPTGAAIRITEREGLPSGHVNHLFAGRGGALWISTERGVLRREPGGRTRLYDRGASLPDAYVYWTGEDGEGATWMGTNRGVVRLPAKGPPELYGKKDGLGSDECNDDGFLVDSGGRVLVATVGVGVFLGTPRARKPAEPVVYLDPPLVDDLPFPGLEGAELPHDCGPIAFRFAAPSFTDERAVRYRYRLIGLSSTWTQTPDWRGETRFGLSPGRYTFEVSARTGDGRSSRSPARVSFSVRPVWWQTPAAVGLLLLLLAGLILLTMAYREGRHVARQQELERRVGERTEELRQANERLELLAVTDPLTGLPNRRRLTERLHEALAFAQRRGTPLSVLLADIDHFKRVNDTLGHAEGDLVLVEVARLVAAGRRTEDAAGRWGGEEFLVVLTGTDESGARAVAERIRLAVESASGRWLDRLPAAPTLSLGIGVHERDLTEAELVRRADAALYRAKRNGRNRVEVWTRELDAGA